ncbi:Selenocysteine insertion sequence-binding protein 2, partial [Lamprotornis superbus]
GIKLSAEVKPFVPKHAAVTVAWSEPSEACVFPRYLTTCYPFVQEPSLDNVLGDPAFREYSNCSYSPGVVANVYPVAGSQYQSNNSTHCNGSGVVSESAEQTYPVRQESKSLSKRRSKEGEKKLDKKRHDGGEASVRIVNRTSFQTSTCSRDSVKPDRFNKTAKKKSTEVPKPEPRPVPTFEASILDFHKSQSLGSSEILNVHHKSTPVSLVETPADGSAQPHVSWAVVLSQPPKKIVSSPASEGLSRSKGKQENEPKQSETKNIASETEPEEESEKKKKKKKKKKKLKSPTDVERPQSESNIIQEPPKIEDVEEFPHLAAASDRRNRVGPQKPFFTSAVRKQSEVSNLATLLGGAIPLLSKDPATAARSHRLNQGKMPHNPLDSSAPLVKKGKQREVPKAKRPTPLKKIILKEREQRKQQHLLEQKAAPKDEDNISQTAGNVTENATLLQDSQAAVPVTQVAEGLQEHMRIKESKEGSVTSKQLTATLPKIHSRNFRDYCSQVLSKEVDSCVTDLLKELVRFQDRLYQKDPVKAKIKRRLVMGLREVLKHLKLKKLKCVIISPNCEKIQSKGGLDETLHNIIDCACEQNIPFVFALNRKALGRCVNKAVPVSVVGIFSYDGAQDHFHRMVQLTTEARKAYKDMIAALEEEAKAGLRETQPSILTPESEKNGLLETFKTSSKDSDEDVPNYIKVWKRKLEEEYNPYALELEKSATADMAILNLEDHQNKAKFSYVVHNPDPCFTFIPTQLHRTKLWSTELRSGQAQHTLETSLPLPSTVISTSDVVFPTFETNEHLYSVFSDTASFTQLKTCTLPSNKVGAIQTCKNNLKKRPGGEKFKNSVLDAGTSNETGRSNRKMTEEMEMRFSSPLWGQCTQYADTVLVAVSAEIPMQHPIPKQAEKMNYTTEQQSCCFTEVLCTELPALFLGLNSIFDKLLCLKRMQPVRLSGERAEHRLVCTAHTAARLQPQVLYTGHCRLQLLVLSGLISPRREEYSMFEKKNLFFRKNKYQQILNKTEEIQTETFLAKGIVQPPPTQDELIYLHMQDPKRHNYLHQFSVLVCICWFVYCLNQKTEIQYLQKEAVRNNSSGLYCTHKMLLQTNSAAVNQAENKCTLS